MGPEQFSCARLSQHIQRLCLSRCVRPTQYPLKLNLVLPFQEKKHASDCNRRTSFLLALPKTPCAASSVLFTHSLAGKEQQHPSPASKRKQGPRFQHARGILRHYRGAGGSPCSPSSSPSPGSCTLLNSCHVPPRNFLQLRKKNQQKKRGALAQK